MKKLISALLLLSFTSPVFADCNLAKDIVVTQSEAVYTLECHRLVGKTFMDNEDRKKVIAGYEQLLPLQKQELALANQRADLWESTSVDLKKDVDSIRSASQYNGYIMFGAGVVTTLLSAYLFRQATK